MEYDLQDDKEEAEFRDIKENATVLKKKEIVVYLTEASFDLDKLKAKNRDEWLETFEMLQQMAFDGHDFKNPTGTMQPADNEPTDLIPQTRLRRFYQTLRIFGGIRIATEIVNYLRERGRSERLSLCCFEEARRCATNSVRLS